MERHPLTKEFITNLHHGVARMASNIIESGDGPASLEMLGEAYVLYMELAILESLPLTPEDIKEHAKSLLKYARDDLRVAAGKIAVDRLYIMVGEDDD